MPETLDTFDKVKVAFRGALAGSQARVLLSTSPLRIDFRGRTCCPITFTANTVRHDRDLFKAHQWREAAATLGMPPALGVIVKLATDNASGHERDVRDELLACVGLTEAKRPSHPIRCSLAPRSTEGALEESTLLH